MLGDYFFLGHPVQCIRRDYIDRIPPLQMAEIGVLVGLMLYTDCIPPLQMAEIGVLLGLMLYIDCTPPLQMAEIGVLLGLMLYIDCIPPLQMAEIGVLLGLMCKHSCEECQFVVYGAARIHQVELEKGTILDNMARVLERAEV